MDFVCNYLTPQTLCRLFLITGNEIYKRKAEHASGCQLYCFYELCSHDMNMLFYNNINVMYLNKKILVCDGSKNAFYASVDNSCARITRMFVENAGSYHSMYKSFKRMFVEYYSGHLVFKKDPAIVCYYRADNTYLPLKKRNKLCVYSNKTLYKIL